MPHPLFTLISQCPETAPESPHFASETSVPGLSPLAAEGPQKSRGDAEGGGGGEGGGGAGAGAAEANPWQVTPGLAILAVLEPPGQDGRPGRVCFAPGLTKAERREILADDEFFENRIRRAERKKNLH